MRINGNALDVIVRLIAEATAAKYVMLGIYDFRKLVAAAVIVCRVHPGRKRWTTINQVESHPEIVASLKENIENWW